MGVIRSWLNLVIVAALAISGGAAQPPSTETFVTVNRCTTVLPLLGKETTAAPVLTTLRSHARQFDTLAPQFVDRFGVLALTRHGKDSSDKPPWGYDSTALAEDIRDSSTRCIDRVSGWLLDSIARDEETRSRRCSLPLQRYPFTGWHFQKQFEDPAIAGSSYTRAIKPLQG